ncbi:MAG: hypothetical protein CEN90_657 [Parcubacteria group bacterium Licking1014_17]|nr:MAG: hypothetical protein CEN90_657 [Parcubacteria group bacterium Licking1014_17]
MPQELYEWVSNLAGAGMLADSIPAGTGPAQMGPGSHCDCVCAECDNGRGSGQCNCGPRDC